MGNLMVLDGHGTGFPGHVGTARRLVVSEPTAHTQPHAIEWDERLPDPGEKEGQANMRSRSDMLIMHLSGRHMGPQGRYHLQARPLAKVQSTR